MESLYNNSFSSDSIVKDPFVDEGKLFRRYMIFFFLSGVTLIVLIMNIALGSVSISIYELWHILSHPESVTSKGSIVWKIRIPRTLGSALGGACLAVSGLLLQVYFRNPIVGPYVLGISSGATLFVSFVMLTTLAAGFTVFSPFLNTLAALVGGGLVLIIILLVASKIKNSVTLLIVGLMMGYLCSAVTSILTALAEKEKIKGFVLWQFGSFSGFKWEEIFFIALLGGFTLIFCHFFLSKPLNVFLLGEDYAKSMGVDIKKFRFLILFSACLLAALITAVAGPVAFIGLAVPHMARLLFSTSDNRVLIPGVGLLGVLVTSLCDLIARMVLSPVEIPISAITSFFGAPIVIGLLLRRRTQL